MSASPHRGRNELQCATSQLWIFLVRSRGGRRPPPYSLILLLLIIAAGGGQSRYTRSSSTRVKSSAPPPCISPICAWIELLWLWWQVCVCVCLSVVCVILSKLKRELQSLKSVLGYVFCVCVVCVCVGACSWIGRYV